MLVKASALVYLLGYFLLFCFYKKNPKGYYVQEFEGFCNRDLGFT